MKLDRWELDRLYSLVLEDLRRDSYRRRDLLNEGRDSDDLRRRIMKLQKLKIKLDRLRKGHDLTRGRTSSE